MKKIVKAAVKQAALNYLLKKKDGLSKLKDLEYTELKMQNYLLGDDLNTRHKKLAFMLRTRMTNLTNNIGMKNICFLCKEVGSEDSQTHVLMNCSVLKKECPQLRQTSVKYEDIFSSDSGTVGEAVKICEISLRKRLELLESK